jgi:RimJ/RimL family protein N-acetyltransferase
MHLDPEPAPLVTERLLLRRSEPEDAEAISAYRSDPDVHITQGWHDTGPDAVRADIEEMAPRHPGEPGGWVQYTLLLRDTGELVGDVGMSAVDDEPGVIKVGYTVDPAHQGRGYATEAIAALIDYAFDVLEAEVVRAHADADNTPSIRVMEKNGLTLQDRWTVTEGGETWHGVRYERRRHP